MAGEEGQLTAVLKDSPVKTVIKLILMLLALVFILPVIVRVIGRFGELRTAFANSAIVLGLMRGRFNNNPAVGAYETQYYNELFSCVDSMIHDAAALGLAPEGATWYEKDTLAQVPLAEAFSVAAKLAYVKDDAHWKQKKEGYKDLLAAVGAFMRVFVEGKAQSADINVLSQSRVAAKDLRAAALRVLLQRAEALDLGTQRKVINPASLMKQCALVEADLYIFARGYISFNNTRNICNSYQSFLLGYLDAFGYLEKHGVETGPGNPFALPLDRRRWLTVYLHLEDYFENPRFNPNMAASFVDLGREFTAEDAAGLVKTVLLEFNERAETAYSVTNQRRLKEDLGKVNESFFLPFLRMLHSQFSWHPVPRDRLNIARGARNAGSAFEQQANPKTLWTFGLVQE